MIRRSARYGYGRDMTKAKTIFLMILCLIGAMGIGAILGMYLPMRGFIATIKEVSSPPFGGKKVIRLLVLGEDETAASRAQGRGLSDTIMLASIDLERKTIAGISIPRDTRVEVPGYGGMQKINATHVLGGPALTAITVERLTGIRPDYYIKTNIEGFRKTVDALGGVEIDVEKNMRYTDRSQKLFINLKKGLQHLDGEHAMQYVRFRHDALGDISRMQRQQKFLQALAKKALAPVNLPKLPKTLSSVMENVKTDMTLKDLVTLGRTGSKMDLNQVKMETLPGMPEYIDGISYWIPDQAKTYEEVRKLFFPETVATLPKVQVLNGSGVVGAATKVAELLKKQGYEVTSVGNAPSFGHATSEVVSHRGSDQSARQLASTIGFNVVRQEPNESAPADVTVIVGKDAVLPAQGI